MKVASRIICVLPTTWSSIAPVPALVRAARTGSPWKHIGKMSNGNGIIIDSNWVPKDNKAHKGRTLIQNNVSFNNGGSGIHSFKSHRVDDHAAADFRLKPGSPALQTGRIVAFSPFLDLYSKLRGATPGKGA